MGNKVVKVQANPGDDSLDSEEITLVYGRKRILGVGSYGVVSKAKLRESGVKVAVKCAKDKHYEKSREVECLKKLKHCNVIKMLYHFRDPKRAGSMECIVMELMPKSLRRLLWEFRDKKKLLPQFDAELYMYQLLRGLAYMHAQGICHRDVKPENALVDPATGIVKLCDFGCSKALSPTNNNLIVGTLRYIAPEIIFHFKNYTNAIDMWSAGCVLFELLKGGERLFENVHNEYELRRVVISYFGTPTEDDFPGMEDPYPFYLLPKRKTKSWSKLFSPYPISVDAISLCCGLLCYRPSSRLLPHEALAHEFFDELRSPKTTCLANGKPLPPLFNFQPGEFPGGFDHLIPSHVEGKTTGKTVRFTASS